MSVKSVIANINGANIQLHKQSDGSYTGAIRAPVIAGQYGLTVTAQDEAGNESSYKTILEVIKWKPPKVYWVETDRFNIVDYNRIKGNLEHLHEKACELYGDFFVENMGPDKLSYSEWFRASECNKFENNLDAINDAVFTQDFGKKVQFYENQPFIMWHELNRIEGACLEIFRLLTEQKMNKPRLSLHFGNRKGVRI